MKLFNISYFNSLALSKPSKIQYWRGGLLERGLLDRGLIGQGAYWRGGLLERGLIGEGRIEDGHIGEGPIREGANQSLERGHLRLGAS